MWKLVIGGADEAPTLNEHVGRQRWIFDKESNDPRLKKKVEEARERFTKEKNDRRQNHSSDSLLRLQALDKIESANIQVPGTEDLTSREEIPIRRLEEHLSAGLKFSAAIQQDDGHWAGDYGGPLFLLPGLVIVLYVTGKIDQVLGNEAIAEMIRYLRNHQNDDGGFGLHIEGSSTMFGSCLNYAMMRILAVSPNDEMAKRTKEWIRLRGGARYCTSWGKFFLAVLGVYSWDGLNPIPPEAWMLPYSMLTGIGVFHPGRMWCHCRMVYLPMSYIYGARDKLEKIEPSPLVRNLRSELYVEPYSSIDWNGSRNLCAKEDLYYPHPWIQDVLWSFLYRLESCIHNSWLRRKALKECMSHIKYEDENTRYICIGPVNKSLNMLARWMEDPDSEAFKMHLTRVFDYLWVAEDGMKMQGYNGSQLWDTSFAVQAFFQSGLQRDFVTCLRRAHSYLEKTQVIEEVPGPIDQWYRHISLGAWPFSTRDHGWPISDCSSEGLKAALLLASMDNSAVGAPIPQERLENCVNVILSYWNKGSGGVATYEQTRSFEFIEIINPAETFGDIVIDYPYVECTSACIQALTAFSRNYPNHRMEEIEEAISAGREYIVSIQKPDGSWYGSWAVCFTYGTWFGLLALECCGEDYDHSHPVKGACDFLVKQQRSDGGWGESYLSCQDKRYSQLDESHVVNTSWAMLGLMAAKYHRSNPKPLHKAAKFLISSQMADGDWPQQHISGVFNRNCMISYTNYRHIFPIWALGKYRAAVLQGEVR